jgi:hypothetical protein
MHLQAALKVLQREHVGSQVFMQHQVVLHVALMPQQCSARSALCKLQNKIGQTAS